MYKSKMFVAGIILSTALVSTACNDEDDQRKIEILTEKHPDTAQEYSIVNTFDLHLTFFDKVKDESDQQEIDRLYKEEVIDPVYDHCFRDAEFIHMAEFLIKSPPQDLEGAQEVIDNTDREKLNDAILESLIRSSEHLSTSEETTVCIFPTKDPYIPVMIAAGAGKITVPYNDEYTEDLIKISIAHEYHHSIWAERNPEDSDYVTVLDNLIFEGKAVMFEKVVYPEIEERPIDQSYVLSYWERIKDDLHKADFNRSMEILNGDGLLPFAYGYTEGYKMVQSYLDKNPDLTPEDWLDTDAMTIFEEGDHLSNYY